MSSYQSYCKPSLAAALHSVGLDYCFHRAKGQYLYCYDENGNEQAILDLLGGYGATILGHNHPEMIRVLQEQIDQGTAFHNQFSIRTGAADLAAFINPLLQQETGWNEPFMCAFSSTGAESVEVALKHAEMSRGYKLDALAQRCQQQLDKIHFMEDAHWDLTDGVLAGLPPLMDMPHIERISWIVEYNQKKLNNPPIFLALKNGFHGKLNLSIQLTYGEMYRKPLRRLGLQAQFIDIAAIEYESIDAYTDYLLEPVVRDNRISLELKPYPLMAGLLVEPVQGEGGVHCLSSEQAQQLNRLARQYQIPMIADEVQSGCGRCGSFLAGSQIGLRPDYVVLSKGLAGGVAKIGLVAIRESQYLSGFDLLQSSTFGEDDWSARIAKRFIEFLVDDQSYYLYVIRERGEQLKKALDKLQLRYPDIIKEVRGKGLLFGIEFTDFTASPSLLIKTTAYQGAIGYLVAGHLLAKNNIRVAPPASQGNVVRIEPSVFINNDNIEHLYQSLEAICLALRYQDTGYILSYLVSGLDDFYLTPKDYRPYYQNLGITTLEGKADYQVAFINHLIASEWIKEVDPSLNSFNAQQTQVLLDRLSFDRRVAPFAPVRIRSLSGKTVDFTLYPINATSQQISDCLENNDLQELRSAIDERLAVARDDGCHIAGLGMFTSVITNNGKAVNTPGIHLTTGNALTVAMAIDATLAVVENNECTIGQVAVIGAAGNIGSVCSSLIADHCQSLVLLGSGRLGSIKRVIKTAYQVYQEVLMNLVTQKIPTGMAAQLWPFARDNQWLRESFYQNPQAGQKIYEWFDRNAQREHLIKVTDDPQELITADLLISCANASESFIQSKHLKQDVLICDIAVPHNISDSLLESRPDIHCLRGGIVKTPQGESLDPRARAYLKEGQVYACMAETIVLGLENYQGHYSYGHITKEQVKTMMSYAKKHGLVLAENKCSESM